MNKPRDPNVALDRRPDAADPPDEAEPGTVDDVAGPASTGGSGRGADVPVGDQPTVPGYRVVREIARGGMGRVFAAYDLGLDRDVALKVLLPGASADRFVRESKITARLPHPGIPPVYALGTLDDGSPFLAMKLVAGQTLAVEMKTADRPRLLQAFTQVCQAVGFAHSRGVIHRDLKPANVMVGAFGEVQVMDWGLAKDLNRRAVADEPRSSGSLAARVSGTEPNQTIDHCEPEESTDDQTQAGQVLGTPAYMAPEQARGEATDARADVFALGGILCVLLTGKAPFGGKSSFEVIQRAAAADLADAHARLDACGADADLVALCRRCVSASPADRPADGQAVADGITVHLNGVQERLRAAEVGRAAEAARAEEATERAKAERRARRIQMIAASLLLLVLAGGVVGTAIGLVKAKRAQEEAQFAQGEEKKRADELHKVVIFQDKMLQLDPAEVGVKLMADLRTRHSAALEKDKATGAEKLARAAAFERELHAVNATDAAVTLLDRTVLAPAVRTIDAQFADQPLVDASLRTTMGIVYQKLGRPTEALALHQRALELRRELLGEEHLDTIASRCGVGEALGELQKLDEAESMIRAALEARRRILGEDHRDTLDAKLLLATQIYYRGRYDESAAIARDVLERQRRLLGTEHPDTLATMSRLGTYLMKRGKYADAVTLLREVLEAQRRVQDSSVSRTLINLGAALVLQKEFAAAESCVRESLERTRQEKGEDHPSTLEVIDVLTTLLMDMGNEKLAEAEPLARESLEKCRRVYGDEHIGTLKSMNILGQVLFRQNKLTEAEPYYRGALATSRRVLGEDHPETIVFIANMGFVLQRLGRLAEAEPYYREALDKNRRQLGETHPYTHTATISLADLLRQQNKPAEAEAYYCQALANVRRTEGDDHPETLRFVGLLGGVLRDQGKLDEAETYFQQAVETTRRLNGEDHASTITAILRMGSLRVAQGKYAEALAVLTPVEGKVTKAISGNLGLMRQASMRGLLGKARAALAKQPAEFAAAETNLLEAHATFARLRGDTDRETRECAQALVDFYTARDQAEPGQGYDAKVTEWKKKLGAAKN